MRIDQSLISVIAASVLSCFLWTDAAAQDKPTIGIIIDDLGGVYASGLRTISLPGPIACAFLPDTRYATVLAQQAHGVHKEVMLHLPMQPISANQPIDSGALTIDMPEQEFIRTVQEDLAKVPYVSGVNNHMGSLMTQYPSQMTWLMRELHQYGNLFFVDSRTDKNTIAYASAQAVGLPSLNRDVFLDDNPSREAVLFQFNRLLDLAKKNGYAIAIGHPSETTLSILEEQLLHLDERGVQLAPISIILEQAKGRNKIWQASLSHSPKVVKN